MADESENLRPTFAYLRKSRDRREKDDPEVLARHRAILCSLMAQHGHCGELYEDVGSGESIGSRPRFRALLGALTALPDCPREHAGGRLYVMDADRISRGDSRERAEIQELLRRKGILICTPAGVTDLRDTDQRLLHNVRGALAEWELGKYKDRVQRTRSLQVREGQVRTGTRIFGYEWDFKAKVPRPSADFPILVAMCRDAFHLSTRQLAAKYGISYQRVHSVLTSPIICGYPARNTEPRVSSSGTRYPFTLPLDQYYRVPGRWPERAGDYPAAMTLEDWLRLQRHLSARRKGRSGTARENHWCRDVVRINGNAVKLGTYHGWGGVVAVYETRDQRLYVKRDIIHDAAREALRAIFADPQTIPNIRAAAARERPPSSGEGLETRREELRKELVALERKAATLEGERALALEAAILECARELESVKRDLRGIQGQAPLLSAAEAQRLAMIAERFRAQFDTLWSDTSDEERRGFARLMLERIDVTLTREREGWPWQRGVTVTPRAW